MCVTVNSPTSPGHGDKYSELQKPLRGAGSPASQDEKIKIEPQITGRSVESWQQLTTVGELE